MNISVIVKVKIICVNSLCVNHYGNLGYDIYNVQNVAYIKNHLSVLFLQLMSTIHLNIFYCKHHIIKREGKKKIVQFYLMKSCLKVS